MPAWRSQTSVSGIAPSDHRQRAMPASRSGVCLENTSAPGARARVAQACDDDPCPPGLAVPDRDLPPRLPEIELADLARAINRALKRPRRRREQRADFAQVVVDDRLAAIETELHDQLADALPRQPRIRPEQPVDLVLERIELRSRRRPRITRPVITPKRVADRLPVHARPAMDLPDRQAAHEMQPPHLRPLLHSDHLGPPKLALRKRTQAPRTPGRSGGPVFNRRRWSSFHPAPTPQIAPPSSRAQFVPGRRPRTPVLVAPISRAIAFQADATGHRGAAETPPRRPERARAWRGWRRARVQRSRGASAGVA